ncbi:DinB family protein [bacterium]|nr:DinB family protein [bacterium]
MFSTKGLLQLHRWTHESLDVLFAHCAPLPFRTLTTRVEGFGYKTVRNQLLHIIETEKFWLWKLDHPTESGRLFESWNYGHWRSLEAINEQRSSTRATFRSYVSALPSRDMLAPITLQWPGSRTSDMHVTRALVLHHSLTHAYHHKGQAVAMLRLLGHPAPDTDLLRF